MSRPVSLAAAFPTTLPIFSAFRSSAEGRSWLASLPSIVLGLAAEWELRLGEPFHGGTSSWVAAVTRVDGTPAVLKVSWPHREAREEATGLRAWAGVGAVRVLAAAPQHYALLLERCEPGVPLNEAEHPCEERLEVAAQLLRRLWSAPVPSASSLERVADVCAAWGSLVRYRMQRLAPPYDPGLVEIGASLLVSLPTTATREVVVHGDLNPGNILTAKREPWLAIDAKPMIGDPGYDPAPLLLQVDPPFARPDPVAVLASRFRLLADAVGEPAERLLAWSVARTVEDALWFADRGQPERGTDAMARARVLARAAGL